MNLYLIKNFMIKDLKNRYSCSVIGFIWSIIHPLTILAVYSVVFSWMLKMRVGVDFGTDNFSIWLFSGLLPWTFFAESLSRSTTVVMDNANLIKKTVFPSEILHVSLLLSNGINFLIGYVILMLGVFFTGGHIYLMSFIYILVYLLPLILMILGLSWLSSCLNVYFRDFGQLITVILNIWFYATAIIYPITVVPEKFKVFFFWNPLLHVINGFRAGVLKGMLIDIPSIIYLYSFSIFIFFIGQLLYQKTKKGFVDVI